MSRAAPHDIVSPSDAICLPQRRTASRPGRSVPLCRRAIRRQAPAAGGRARPRRRRSIPAMRALVAAWGCRRPVRRHRRMAGIAAANGAEFSSGHVETEAAAPDLESRPGGRTNDHQNAIAWPASRNTTSRSKRRLPMPPTPEPGKATHARASHPVVPLGRQTRPVGRVPATDRPRHPVPRRARLLARVAETTQAHPDRRRADQDGRRHRRPLRGLPGAAQHVARPGQGRRALPPGRDAVRGDGAGRVG